MPATKSLINSYTSVSTACSQCRGKCYDKNQSIRHANFREAFPEIALPDKCVDSCIGKTMCPAITGAL